MAAFPLASPLIASEGGQSLGLSFGMQLTLGVGMFLVYNIGSSNLADYDSKKAPLAFEPGNLQTSATLQGMLFSTWSGTLILKLGEH